MARIRQSPGIELHEIDRSQYDDTSDNSIVGTTTLVMGFSDKGENYDVKYINSIQTLQQRFGTPTRGQEAETYFYNACQQVLSRGGRLLAARLPYDNNSLNNYSYVKYDIDPNLIKIESVYEFASREYPLTAMSHTDAGNFNQLASDVYDALIYNNVKVDGVTNIGDITGPNKLYQCVLALLEDSNDANTGNSLKQRFENVFSNLTVSLIDAIDFAVGHSMYSNFKYHQYPFAYELADFINDNIIVSFDDHDRFEDVFNGTIESLNTIRLLFDGKTPDGLDNESEQIVKKFGTNKELIKQFINTVTVDKFKVYYDQYVSILEQHKDEPIVARFIAQTSQWYYDTVTAILNQRYIDLKQFDNTINYRANISNSLSSNGLISIDQYDKLLIDDMNVEHNAIRIVDIARNNLEEDEFGNQIFGIMPVITTPANAMYFQNIINADDSRVLDYGVLTSVVRNAGYDRVPGEPINGKTKSDTFAGLYEYLGTEDGLDITRRTTTVTTKAVDLYPIIKFKAGHVDQVDIKTIGVVLFKVFRDKANEGKIGFLPIESYTGTLKKNQIDPVTGKKVFIEDVVNSNSRLINIFVNIDPDIVEKVSTFTIDQQFGTILGFTKEDTKKLISVKTSIIDGMTKIFDACKDINTVDIDIILDAGISTIGQFIASVYENGRIASSSDFIITEPASCGCPTYKVTKVYKQTSGYYDLTTDKAYAFKLKSTSDTAVWSAILKKFDDFCKNVRKDCIFLADSPRSFCLEGNQPLVRKTRPDRNVKNTIIPKIKLISGVLNSSYSAGYTNWFYATDYYTGDFFWCPPSIKAATVYLYTDAFYNYWNAPAGMNRGVINDVYDVAFNPTDRETWDVYSSQWNYALSYPLEGIVLEGQKTFQIEKTALDRVNVRRLMLGLEKVTRGYAKYFNYEQNTEWTRELLTDTIESYFSDVKTRGGLNDYRIICDDTNNTVQTIENNELHITIAVKPVKAIEFIVLNFICTNQSADVSEIANEYV